MVERRHHPHRNRPPHPVAEHPHLPHHLVEEPRHRRHLLTVKRPYPELHLTARCTRAG